MARLWKLILRALLITSAAYGVSVICGIDSMARTAWYGRYQEYIGIFLFLSTVGLLITSMIEARYSIVSHPAAGFGMRVVVSCISSWIALICISYSMASSHNRHNLEFMMPGVHFLLEAYMSGAILYGVCVGCVNLCFAFVSGIQGVLAGAVKPGR